jgi:hypothetical protein
MPATPPRIIRDFDHLPPAPCDTGNLNDYQKMLMFHTITGFEYIEMINSFFLGIGTTYLPFVRDYNYVMSHTVNSGANCNDSNVKLEINEAPPFYLTIGIVQRFDNSSEYALSLFQGFDLMLQSIPNFNSNYCRFEFIQGKCFYNNDTVASSVVIVTIKYNDVVLGYYDISIPPPPSSPPQPE